MAKSGKRSRRSRRPARSQRPQSSSPHKVSGGLGLLWRGTTLPRALTYNMWVKIKEHVADVYGDMKRDNYQQYKESIILAKTQLDTMEQKLVNLAGGKGLPLKPEFFEALGRVGEYLWMRGVALLLFSGKKENNHFGVMGCWSHNNTAYQMLQDCDFNYVCERIRKHNNYHKDDTFEEESDNIDATDYHSARGVNKFCPKGFSSFLNSEGGQKTGGDNGRAHI